MLENSWYKKENPFIGLTGMGGGVGSNLVLFGGSNRDQLLLDREGVATNSLRFNNQGAGWPASSGDSAYLSKVFGTPTNTKIWTFSTWFKKSINGDYCALFNGVWVGGQGRYGYITIDNNDQLTVFLGQYPNGNPDYIYFTSSQKLIDTSAWYHICVAVDTTQATESDRFSAYINGVEVTSWDVETYPDQNEVYHINNNDSSGHMIGAIKNTVNTGHSRWGNGYQAETIFIDGQKKAASDFGEPDATTGQWIPKAYAGTYGNNGVHLKYDNTSDLGEDSSGNGNDWSAINFSTSAGAGNDVLDDSPSTYDYGNGVGNYCTLSAIDQTGAALSNGNLDAELNTAGSNYVNGTIAVSSGKWYFETTMISGVNSAVGVVDVEGTPGFEYSGSYVYYADSGDLWFTSGSSYGAAWDTADDIVGVAIDMDTPQLTFYKNNASQGVAVTSWLSGKTVAPIVTCGGGAGNKVSVNFGQRPFEKTVPTGFKALNTYNLDAPLIDDPSEHFDIATDTGANILSAATGLTDGADFVWIKDRDNNSTNHILFNRINDTGMDGTPHLRTNNDTEATCGTYSAPSGNSVGWVWNAGSSTVSNTDGSITSSVRANTTAGFSIVSYTGNDTSGATVGHGLGATPNLWMLKQRSGSGGMWIVRSTEFANTHYLELGGSHEIRNPVSDVTGDADPTTSVVPVGDADSNNNADYIGYFWSEIPGYSRISSYTGNGNTDGPFVWCGHKPAWVMVKNIDATSDWRIYDSTRNATNPVNLILYPNDTYEDTTTAHPFDFLSNGFKIRGDFNDVNTSGNTYIFCAFAESPFRYSNAR